MIEVMRVLIADQLEEYRNIIRAPIITEKSMEQAEQQNKYHFEVHSAANKVQIRYAVEALFNVRVEKVNTVNVKGKARQRSYRHQTGMTARRKKAIVTLASGDHIELIET